MIWDVVKAAVNQPKERIGGQMLTYLWCNDGHGKPRHENITSFKSGGIFASRFTKCQCSSHGEHSPWRLSGNCCLLCVLPCDSLTLGIDASHWYDTFRCIPLSYCWKSMCQ